MVDCQMVRLSIRTTTTLTAANSLARAVSNRQYACIVITCIIRSTAVTTYCEKSICDSNIPMQLEYVETQQNICETNFNTVSPFLSEHARKPVQLFTPISAVPFAVKEKVGEVSCEPALGSLEEEN